MTFRSITGAVGRAPEYAYAYVSKHAFLRTVLVFSFFFLVFAAIYLPNTMMSAGDDHFFHFRFAYEMREQGFWNAFANFKSIYASKIADGAYYPYYNFLFYLVVIPFTYIEPLWLGIKLYAVIAAALFFTVLYLTVRYFKVEHAFLWVASLFSIASTESVWRLLLSRPYVLAPAFLVALVVCLHRRKYFLAALVSFLYLYWYDATFFFPFATALVYYVFEQLYTGKAAWRGLLWVLGGTVASVGLVVLFTPGFFTFLHDIIFGDVLTVSQQIKIPEGGELYPADIFTYIRDNIVLFSGLILACCFELWVYVSHKRPDMFADDPLAPVRGALVFLAAGFFGADVLVSGRFGDYLLMLFGLYFIMAMSRLLAEFSAPPVLKVYLFAGTLLVILYLFFTAAFGLNSFIASSGAPVQTLEGTGTWLADNTQPGDVVYDATWNWFAQLYYWSPSDDYVVGIEPRFLYTYSAHLYWLWYNISGYGIVCDTEWCPDAYANAAAAYAHPGTAATKGWDTEEGNAIAAALTDEFHAKYIVSSYTFPMLNAVLDNNAHFTKVYGGNRTYYIYRITP